MALPKSVPTKTEALFLFHKLAHVRGGMGNRRLLERVQWMKDDCSRVAGQAVTRVWSTSSKFTGLGIFQTAYSPYSMYERRVAMLQVLKTREDGFLPPSQRESFDGVGGAVSSEAKVDKAACERFGPGDHAR